MSLRLFQLFRTSLAVCVTFACLLPDVNAQVTTADLVGTVKDSSGDVVPGVQVTASNEATGISRSTITDDAQGAINGIVGIPRGADYRPR